MFGSAQHAILLVVSVAALAVEVYALADSLRYSNETYYSAGKRNKAFWTAMLGAAAAVGFLGLPHPLGRSSIGPLGLLGIIAVVIAVVYIVDVRQALRDHHRPSGARRDRGGW